MSVVNMVPVAVSAASALAFAAYLLPWGRRPATCTADGFARDLEQAPVVLRPAILSFGSPAHSQQMFSLLKLGNPETGFPSVEWWDYSRHGLTVDLLMGAGQTLSDWASEDVRSRMADHIGVDQVTVSSPARGWVRLELRVHDTLAEAVVTDVQTGNVTAAGVDLESVPVGVREDGTPWLLRILYSHILIAGATGSGKGSVLWSILLGLGPAIKAGFVDVWLIDPKGGVEFGVGEDKLFVRFATDAPTVIATLTEAVKVMEQRQARMRAAGLRKLVPSKDEPLILLIIDEAAALSSYAERDQQEEFRRQTGKLQSQGRAVGVSVIAAVQDPSKEVMPNRQLFPTRIGLRLEEPTQIAMIHGKGARDKGALCDEIPEETPGVGYVGEDGKKGFVRVRAYWITDEQTKEIVDRFSPAADVDFAPAEDYSDFDPDDLGDDDIPGDGYSGPVAA
ncbi:FtsK/SpoIIIE domain-containing protein [Nocardia africana]|uniref:FtsK/SpoIIIE domain-containing protein n=1 Tax=Nocardia africana TaxID=134964 RepID=A0ABW6NCR4_9NOCA